MAIIDSICDRLHANIDQTLDGTNDLTKWLCCVGYGFWLRINNTH